MLQSTNFLNVTGESVTQCHTTTIATSLTIFLSHLSQPENNAVQTAFSTSSCTSTFILLQKPLFSPLYHIHDWHKADTAKKQSLTKQSTSAQNNVKIELQLTHLSCITSLSNLTPAHQKYYITSLQQRQQHRVSVQCIKNQFVGETDISRTHTVDRSAVCSRAKSLAACF